MESRARPAHPGYGIFTIFYFKTCFKKLRFARLRQLTSQIDIGSTVHMGCWEKRDNELSSGHIADGADRASTEK
jgi:hypothetical protein